MSKVSLKDQRAWVVIRYLQERPGVEFTIDELAVAVEMPRCGFDEVLGRARKLCSLHGMEISYCFDRGGEMVLCFAPDDDQFFRSMSKRGRSILAQNVNFNDHLEWGAVNVQNPLMRSIVQRTATATAAAVTMTDAMQGMASDVFEAMQKESAS